MPFVENIVELERWLSQMLRDAKEKLNISDETIAHLLLREGMAYYSKTLGRSPEKPKKAP